MKIMNIPMLPNWAILRSRYAFEDTESNTAVEQTARLYKAIQEIIDSCNEFSKSIQNEVDTFTTNQSKDYEENKAELTKIMHEFIHSIDTKVDTAVNYMTDNLTDAVQNMSGEIIEGLVDEKVTESLGNYETRLTTLENTEYSLVHDVTTEELTLVKSVGGEG
jgi:DNA anti-recombination protein RmuC